MPDNAYYSTVEKPIMASFKERGSKFIAYLFPADAPADLKIRLSEIKKEHPKATHHCFAYRLGLDGHTFRVSDDGEPSGSAGRPILGQIDKHQLTNVLIIVVRYFGGTQLGIPGLIHAYKSSAALVLQSAEIVQKPVLQYFQLKFDYQILNDIMRLLRQFECKSGKQDLQLSCILEVGVPVNRVEDLKIKLNDLKNVEINVININK